MIFLRNLFQSISTRIFLILLFGVLSAALLTWWFAYGERQYSLNLERNNHRSERVERYEQLVHALAALPIEHRTRLLTTVPRMGIKSIAVPIVASNYLPVSPSAQALMEKLRSKYEVQALPASPTQCIARPNDRTTPDSCEAIIVVFPDNGAIQLTVSPTRSGSTPIQTETIFYWLLFLSIIAALAWIVSRMTIKPLKKLAQAATDLGADLNRPPLPEQGALEILQATRAFNSMQKQIRDYIQERTQMLAAITHDLQTPLTRIRLRLEKVEEDGLREKLINDLSDIQSMVKEGLDLARSMDNNEQWQVLDLDSLLQSLCDDAQDAGHQVSLNGKTNAKISARPQSLQRCLNNLIDNAINYGDVAQIFVTLGQDTEQGQVIIRICDQGPGIPVELQEKVLEPFFRIEDSRSRESGGTGLGLTIAHNILLQHQGKFELINRPEGGLMVKLSLPLRAKKM
jgi:signal transduction histidine kinase